MSETSYISVRRLRRYDRKIKQYIEEHGGGAESIAIEDKPALNKLLVTLNPNDPQTMAQYLVARDPYTAPATPTFSPASGGSGNGSLAVTISTATAGASVRYQINGGAWQTGTSVTLQQDTAQESKAYIIIAKAVKDGLESDEVTASYTVNRQVAQPTYASASGNKYSASRTITFACDTAGATIQYKIGNGSWTDGSSVTINATSKITIRAIKDGWVNSSSPTAVTYTIGANRCYIGQAATLADVAAIKALTYGYDQDTLVVAGDVKDVDFGANTEYCWFCIPSTAAKNLVVKSEGFGVTLQDAAGSTVDNTYRVWRTANKINSSFHFEFS